MRGSDGIIALTAVAVSLLAHGLLLFNDGTVAGNSDQAQPQQQTTRVSFRSVAAPPSPPEPAPVPEKPPEPEVVETPEPPTRPPEPEPVETKPAQKALQPEPQEKPPQPAAEPMHTAPAEPGSTSAQKAPAPAEKVQGTIAEPGLTEQAKQEYLRRLMAHIEAHKRYPRVARRRGIEGDVAVSFELNGAGAASTISATGAHTVLLSAAREALQEAQPMPRPPEGQPLPWTIEFTMRFTLR